MTGFTVYIGVIGGIFVGAVSGKKLVSLRGMCSNITSLPLDGFPSERWVEDHKGRPVYILTKKDGRTLDGKILAVKEGLDLSNLAMAVTTYREDGTFSSVCVICNLTLYEGPIGKPPALGPVAQALRAYRAHMQKEHPPGTGKLTPQGPKEWSPRADKGTSFIRML